MTTPDPAAQLAGLMDLTQIIAETAVGYRKKLVDGGCSVELAESMTKDFHDMLLAQARAGAEQSRRAKR